MKKLTFVFAIAIGTFSFLMTDLMYGIPTFARKYRQSCTTCHVIPPKLNQFGRTFKRNGYFWPGGDAAVRQIKEIPMNAGIFNGGLAESAPLSFAIELEGKYYAKRQNMDQQPVTNFVFAEVEMFWGGTIGDRISYFMIMAGGTGEGELGFETGQIQINDLGGMFNLKMGKKMGGAMMLDGHGANGFLPTGHKTMGKSYIGGDVNTNANATGIELNGEAGPIYWGLGMNIGIDTNEDTDDYKDIYAFVEANIGSISARVHFMYGTQDVSTNVDGSGDILYNATILDKRMRMGVNIDGFFNPLFFSVIAFYTTEQLGGSNRVDTNGTTVDKATALGFLVQVDYVAMGGKFNPSIRFEYEGPLSVDAADGTDLIELSANTKNGIKKYRAQKWVHIGFSSLLAENIVWWLGARLNLDASDANTYNVNENKSTLDVVEAKMLITF